VDDDDRFGETRVSATSPHSHSHERPRTTAGAREQSFWDAHVQDLDRVVHRYEQGPDPNTRAMLDAVEPVKGRRVLDFACGAGLTAAFLAQRGARVTAIDISPASIERARQLAERAGLEIELIAGELAPTTFPPHTFDAIVGRYALHHVDLRAIAPILADLLVAGGRGAFLETMGLNLDPPIPSGAEQRMTS
jgi:2-polyprenyl-3-methyl-5-hydroxy-6-metoxy-1,4-benzoquinol methylase